MLSSRRDTRSARLSYPIWRGSVAVPADFVGVHIHRWPLGVPPSPGPSYPFGMIRSHDYGPPVVSDRPTWARVNPSNGVFDWSGLDKWVNQHYGDGRSLWYTIYQCPTWAARAMWQGTADPYGHLGGGSPPNNLADLGAFVTALVTRYNSGGVRKIKYIEGWNEPDYAQNGTGFFWGSAADMAAMQRTIYVAAKAADPGIIVSSPGFAGDSTMAPFLNASDGSGGFGRQHFDVFAHHPYGICGISDHIRNADNFVGPRTQRVRDQMVLGGLSAFFPLYASEVGYDLVPGSSFITNSSPTQFAAWIKKTGVMLAAHGWKSVCWYSHDDELSGDPSKNAVVASAIGWLHSNIAGKTLTEVRRAPIGWEAVTNAGIHQFP